MTHVQDGRLGEAAGTFMGRVDHHIGTGLTLAAWNAAAYVAQIDEGRLADALASGVYVPATQRVLQRSGGVWFNDEAYVIARSR